MVHDSLTILNTDGSKTFLHIEDKTLFRLIDSRQHTILLKDTPSLEKLSRLANIDNESFKLMANIQEELNNVD